jgi:putative Ca2+/H+ antiporter (TMEM165/GDT1 family)
MDALLPTFLAALFAEFGDKTQLLAALLAVRFRATGTVFAAIAAAALANSLIAAAGGRIVADLVNFRAIALMVAVALIAAGVGGLFRQKPPASAEKTRFGVFATVFGLMFVLEFGDKTQFLTFTLAARADSLWLAAMGATAGILAAAAPAVLLGDRLGEVLPLRQIRLGASLLFLIVGVIAAAGALRLW